jgi:ubiquinone/menaquinone biosynthesis C-methylase UbiE
VIHFTGERVVPGEVNDDLWAEHFCRYAFASQFTNGRQVLDIGSGSGYGTAELARTASKTFGLELGHDATRYATTTFPLANLVYTTGSATQLPFPDNSFDVVTAFEIIEHLADWQNLLSEARRVLKSTGLFLVSTPNRLYYTESRGADGPNPYHVHEFQYAEFQSALQTYFSHTRILLQNHVHGFALHQQHDRPVDAQITERSANPDEAHFFLALCSQTTFPDPNDYIYIPRASNVLREREHHIRSLEEQLAEEREQRRVHLASLEGQLSVEREERQLHVRSLEKEIRQAREQYENLEHDRDEKRLWAERLDVELQTARKTIDAAERTVIERTQWAERLDAELRIAREAIDTAERTLIERTEWAQRLDQEFNQANDRIARNEAARWTRLGRQLGFLPPLDQPSAKKDD